MKKTIFIKFIALLCLLSVLLTMFSCKKKEENSENESKTVEQLYSDAVRDAVFAEEDEILPLVNITKDDKNVLWDGDKVLVAFLHKYPDSYPDGQEINLKWGNVWVVSALEFYKWVQDNSKGVEDWSLRLHQVMGMPEGKATSVTTMWIDADLLYRPAYVTGNSSAMKTTLEKTGNEEFDTNYKTWFDSNIVWSYFDSAYPWTRLGYTYDWADNGREYGLSEFLIFSGADAKIERTFTINDFVAFAKDYK